MPKNKKWTQLQKKLEEWSPGASKIIDIKNTYADAVPANGSLPFEVSVFSKEEIATVDVYANQW